MIKTKRIYYPFDKQDGYRILVDRLWPRGIKKEDAHVDLWLKDIAPSDSLRKWFAHDPEKWNEFMKRYKAELLEKKELLDHLTKIISEKHTVTLLYAAKDEMHNNAIILKGIFK